MDAIASAIDVANRHRIKLHHSIRAPMPHVGPINSGVAGRTDHLPMHVPSGSYVLPADIVSAHGEGNTIAGFKVLRRVFGGVPYKGGSMPYGATGGPYGEPLGRASGGSVNGTMIHKNPTLGRLDTLTRKSSDNYMRGIRHGEDHYWWDGAKAIHKDGAEGAGVPYDYQDRLESTIRPSGEMRLGWDNHGLPKALRPPDKGPTDEELLRELKANGGRTSTVPIVAAGGEMVLSPEEVMHVGGGDLDTGHRVLDEFVKRVRAKTIKTLTKLPGPAKG